MAVIKAAPTLMDHSCVPATVDSHSPVMEVLVWTTMSAHWKHTTVNKSVSTLMEDSDVNVIQDLNLTLIKPLVQVSSFKVSGVIVVL